MFHTVPFISRRFISQTFLLSVFISALITSCSTYNTAFSPTATAPNVISPTIVATAFQGATPSSTPTPIGVLTPTSSPTAHGALSWDFRIAYVTSQLANNKPITQIWVLESPYHEPRLILSTESENLVSNYILAWSHGGRQIAYSHFIGGKREAISVVDIFSLEQRQLFSISQQPYGSGSNGTLELSSSSWSSDDQLLAVFMRYKRSAEDLEQKKTFILSTTHEQISELDDKSEFVAWSPKAPDQFLYIVHPQFPTIGQEIVNIGKVGQGEPVKSISDLDKNAPSQAFDISWSPDGSRAIAVSSEDNLRTIISLLDFQKVQWKTLPYTPAGVGEPDLWSPDGKWIMFWQGADMFFWNFDQSNQPTTTPLPQDDFVSSAIWTPDSSMLIYQDGHALYAVDPSAPQKPSLVIDLNTLGIKSDWDIHAFIWMSSSP